MIFAMIPPEGMNAWLFEIKLIAVTVLFVGSGIVIYWIHSK